MDAASKQTCLERLKVHEDLARYSGWLHFRSRDEDLYQICKRFLRALFKAVLGNWLNDAQMIHCLRTCATPYLSP